MNPPTVSVIIPFYAGADWLCEAVQSVLDQTYKDYEIIVVNDGSKEDDSEFVSKYGDKVRYIRKPNSGPGPTRNLGVQESQGKYLAFLDSDDIWLPDKLEKQIAYLEETGEVWCMSTYTKFGEDMEEQFIDNSYYQNNLYPICFYHMHFATPSVVVRKNYLLEHHLRFAENMRYGQDAFLWMNIILSGQTHIKVFEEPLIKVRMRHGENANRRVLCHIQGKSQLWDYLRVQVKDGKVSMPFFARFLYYLCHFGFSIVKHVSAPKIKEFLAKCFYIFPFVCFKMRTSIWKRQQQPVL